MDREIHAQYFSIIQNVHVGEKVKRYSVSIIFENWILLGLILQESGSF